MLVFLLTTLVVVMTAMFVLAMLRSTHMNVTYDAADNVIISDDVEDR